jgi:PAS domain S-box-containing protein
MDWLMSFFGRNGFLPHGYCFTWAPGLLYTMVVSDLLIAAAYLSIPVGIISLIRQRGEPALNGMAWLFSAFILACGTTHMMDVWTIWRPDYGLQATAKALTAAISVVTAVMLWPLIPKAVKVPTVTKLQAVIASLATEVSRRRSAEDQVREIQQNLSVTLASIGAGFLATDREGRVTRMNGVAERVTGWAERDAIGKSLWDVFVRADGPRPDPRRNPVDVFAQEFTSIERVQRFFALAVDGRRTLVEAQCAVTQEDDGTARGLAIVLRDMTQAVKDEAASATLAAIVASSTDAIIGKTLDGTIATWNQAAESMFGYTASEAIGQPVQTLIPPELQDEEMRILEQLREGRIVPAFDTRRRAKDGRLIDVSITLSPIRDADGRVLGTSKIARDISQHRLDELALRDTAARLSFTLESAHLGDWSLELASGAMRHSQRHDRCFGFDAPQADWSIERLFACVHPQDRAQVEQIVRAAIAAPHGWRHECRVVWPDASVHWIAMHASVQVQGERATRMLGIVSEITQQRQAQEARLKAQQLEVENRQIQEASRLKNQFLANMSHELRTPLNAVIGFADLLQSDFAEPDSPKRKAYLGHIGTSGRHLLKLINDVLDLSKVESGKFEFHPEPIDLGHLFDEVTDILLTTIQHKHIRVTTQVDPTLAPLHLDPARLKQVLYNYLSNAIKFTPPGGRVDVRAMAQGAEHLCIEVEDSGDGIAAADLPRLFTDFQQLDASYSKRHEGTGLGLALTRRLVQAQGGSVGVRSTPGVGSVFHVLLNRVHGTDAARAAAGLDADRSVLQIEGESDARARMTDALTRAGYRVDAAVDSDAALEQARDTSYSALTLDLRSPEPRGLELLARIRSTGASHAAPVIGLSMPANDAAARFAVANLLCKPIRSDEILRAMTPFRRTPPGPANVLVIDDDVASLDLMRATLKSIGIDANCMHDALAALDALDRLRPEAIILDLMMPGFDGFQTLDALRRMPAWRDVPVFIWTSMLLTDEEYAALARSASAILFKGGGAMDDMLDALRHWRPPVETEPGDTTP